MGDPKELTLTADDNNNRRLHIICANLRDLRLREEVAG